jgi:hypothetical protein
MSALPLAHAGHWALWILYAVPVVVVIGSIVVTMRRERRGKSGAATDAESGKDP